MARIVHLSSVHPPYDVRIFHKECGSIAKAGHEVILVHAGKGDAERNGVRLIQVPAPTGRVARMLRTSSQLYHVALGLQADIYHFHDPELILLGLRLRLHGRKVVYDVHEELPQDIMEKAWLPKPLRLLIAGAAYLCEGVAGLAFNGIIASRPALLGRFPARKTALVNNYPMLGELAQPGAVPIRERPPICAYVGGMSPERGFLELVEALGRLPDTVPLEVHIAGLVDPPELVETAQKMPGWKRVRLLGWQSRAQVADLLNRSRFGVVTFLPIANHIRSHPTKLFEYMSAGLPTLGSNIPLWQEIIVAAGVGRTADPKDPQAFAAALQWMAEHPEECETMGRTGVELINTRYNWSIEADSLLALYRRILGVAA